jgi:hypothetical protein
MKRLIFLQLHYSTTPAVRSKAFQQFRDDIKKLPDIKIIKEYDPKPQVLIEFPDNQYQEVYDALRQLEVVEVIDSILPEE